ncbi:hypothetical protein BTM25_12860 [Actinomadura rubteroloni]|uniref:Uncharacterized protein n=1 Tax=Actinomadura rubteroloni TaxID=1926885 RepID=A0A2P4UPA1_9ACTN|nr:hypothetical protein [Actinomadura rubteroloni]POM26878.1 hypothetical protein BTM25_12860 [Actinomadura rubteroloni]
MSESDLLRRIESDRTIADLLAWPGDFDIDRRDPVEDLRLPNGRPLHPIAGDAGGGTYFLVGDPGDADRPVLYADSEGSAGLIAGDLAEAVTLVACFPYWRDLDRDATDADVAELEEIFREDGDEFDTARAELLAALGITPPPREEAVARLHAAVARTAPEYVPSAPGNPSYELLFHY